MDKNAPAPADITPETADAPPPWASDLAKAKELHPRAEALVITGRKLDEPLWIIVKPPSRAALHRYLDSAEKMADKEQLVRDCLIFPSKERLREIFEEYPYAAAAWWASVNIIAGAAWKVEGKG